MVINFFGRLPPAAPAAPGRGSSLYFGGASVAMDVRVGSCCQWLRGAGATCSLSPAAPFKNRRRYQILTTSPPPRPSYSSMSAASLCSRTKLGHGSLRPLMEKRARKNRTESNFAANRNSFRSERETSSGIRTLNKCIWRRLEFGEMLAIFIVAWEEFFYVFLRLIRKVIKDNNWKK